MHKNTNIGSVYYNKQRKNWIASYNIIDVETKKNNNSWRQYKKLSL